MGRTKRPYDLQNALPLRGAGSKARFACMEERPLCARALSFIYVFVHPINVFSIIIVILFALHVGGLTDLIVVRFPIKVRRCSHSPGTAPRERSVHVQKHTLSRHSRA